MKVSFARRCEGQTIVEYALVLLLVSVLLLAAAAALPAVADAVSTALVAFGGLI
jgi:Flp pilus assembly pilin Flp